MFKHRYSPPKRFQTKQGGPSKVQQHFKESCDLNYIMAKYARTGILPVNRNQPQFGDFTNIKDHASALNAVMDADNAFMSLPAKIRKRFGNNPQYLLEFVNNEQNREEAIKLGLIPEPEDAVPQRLPQTSKKDEKEQKNVPEPEHGEK